MLGSRAYCIGGGSAVSILQMQGSANNGLSRQKADTHERQLRVISTGPTVTPLDFERRVSWGPNL